MAMNLRSRALLVVSPILGLLAACGQSAAPAASAPPPPPPPPAEHVPPPEAAATPAPTPPPERVPTTRIVNEVGFETPESVLYDAAQDVYLVSNINGDPFGKDNNGFIAKLTPEGQVTKFIEGGQGGVTLNAPKGLTFVGDTLLVADIDTVRIFDRTTGAPQGEIPVKGATFLNDLSTSYDGKTVYLSDSGFRAGFSAAGTDAVYKIVDTKVTKLAKGKDLGAPNGLLAADGGVWVVTFAGSELYFLNAAGKKEKAQKLDKGGLDGIVLTNDGKLVVSSWDGSAVLIGSAGGAFVDLLSGVDAPADLGYDTKRNRLLVPLFKKNAVVLHTLDDAPQAATPASPAKESTPAPAAGAPGAAAPETKKNEHQAAASPSTPDAGAKSAAARPAGTSAPQPAPAAPTPAVGPSKK